MPFVTKWLRDLWPSELGPLRVSMPQVVPNIPGQPAAGRRGVCGAMCDRAAVDTLPRLRRRKRISAFWLARRSTGVRVCREPVRRWAVAGGGLPICTATGTGPDAGEANARRIMRREMLITLPASIISASLYQ